ncbi:MAG: hypothetical protein ACRD45_22790 [Bryobacteraceae bacterium]
MSALGDLLGKGSVAEQLLVWGLMNQAIGAAAAPYFSQLQQDVNARTPVAPLAPGDLADAVVRNYKTLAEATAEAAKSGVRPADFATMVPLHADAPGPQQLAVALLRGIIPEAGSGPDAASFIQGIREGRLADKWAPMIRELSTAILSPPDAASAVVRNFMSATAGEAEAAKSGVGAATFQTLVSLSGDAPGPQQLAEALRRGSIPESGTGSGSTSFTQGIAEGRLADKWAPVIKELSLDWPTPVAALSAQLKGAFSGTDGKAMYEKLGGDPQFYDWLLFGEGSAPTPNEAAGMARRGIIPQKGTGQGAVTFEQAFLEGPWRNKWQDAFWQYSQFIPTAREVITLLKDGAVDKATAAVWMKRAGADDATTAAFIAEADTQALSDYKGLTQSSVLNMYYQRLITSDDATSILESLHVSPQAVPLMLAYADLQRAIAQQNSAISRVGTLYAARKITVQTARQSLITLQVPTAALDDIMSTWQLENSISVKLLTEAQIVDAWEYGVMSEGEALTELGNIGYTPYDSWVLLSLKAKAPLSDKPGQGPSAPQGAVIPGTT